MANEAQQLVQTLLSKGWKQNQIAQAIGIDFRLVSSIRRGERQGEKYLPELHALVATGKGPDDERRADAPSAGASPADKSGTANGASSANGFNLAASATAYASELDERIAAIRAKRLALRDAPVERTQLEAAPRDNPADTQSAGEGDGGTEAGDGGAAAPSSGSAEDSVREPRASQSARQPVGEADREPGDGRRGAGDPHGGSVAAGGAGKPRGLAVLPGPAKQEKEKKKGAGWFDGVLGFFKLEDIFSEAEAKRLTPQLKKALIDFFKRMDSQAIKRYGPLYSNNPFLPLDDEEADTLTRLLLNRAQRAKWAATLVFHLLDKADWFYAADIVGRRASGLRQLERLRKQGKRGDLA